MDSISADSEDEDTTRHQTTKKRKKNWENVLGEDCSCRLKCFEKVGNQKTEFINRMNSFGSNNSVNAYLAVARRQPRVDDNEAKFRDANFAYNVRFVDDSH
ncbi:hypothetical protein J6590_083467 [Homalodisca vitripennis]|nr:hypothetical protein J6590_083467 [Homalodisca vitripennis]